jgi:hypothetical protein
MKITFPDYYDSFAEFEHESKGYLSDVLVEINGLTHSFDFYEPTRLTQDILDEVKNEDGFYRISSIIVIKNVNRKNIEKALKKIFRYGNAE